MVGQGVGWRLLHTSLSRVLQEGTGTRRQSPTLLYSRQIFIYQLSMRGTYRGVFTLRRNVSRIIKENFSVKNCNMKDTQQKPHLTPLHASFTALMPLIVSCKKKRICFLCDIVIKRLCQSKLWLHSEKSLFLINKVNTRKFFIKLMHNYIFILCV